MPEEALAASASSKTDLRFDVVVPAYNTSATIRRCIEGLFAAGFATDDIVVVDDGSTDDTIAQVKALGVSLRGMGQNSSAAAARNAGASVGTGDIILFVDADVVVASDVRTVLERFFTDQPEYAAVFGAYDDRPAAPGRVSRIRNLLHRHVHLENAGPAITFWSGCGAVRRPAFDAIGGFDQSIDMMEDVDLGLRLTLQGERIMLLPELQGQHLKAWTMIGIAKTDLFNRAIPWARLLKRPKFADLPETLNISTTSRVSAVAVAFCLAGILALAVAPGWALLAIAASLAALVVANAKFIGTLRRDNGLLDALTAIPVLWLHYLCGGLGFTWVNLAEGRIRSLLIRTNRNSQ